MAYCDMRGKFLCEEFFVCKHFDCRELVSFVTLDFFWVYNSCVDLFKVEPSEKLVLKKKMSISWMCELIRSAKYQALQKLFW